MKLYLINLTRSTDRLRRMEARFAALGLSFERIEAVDGRALGPSDRTGALPVLALSCNLSHEIVFRRFLETGDDFAAVFEDDVLLAPAAADLLTRSDWIPPGADIVKIETYGRTTILSASGIELTGDTRLVRLLGKHSGSAGYIIGRSAARRLLGERQALADYPIDHLLFDPRRRPVPGLTVWQVVPALCAQDMIIDPSAIGESTLRGAEAMEGLRPRRHFKKAIKRSVKALRRAAPLEALRAALSRLVGRRRIVVGFRPINR